MGTEALERVRGLRPGGVITLYRLLLHSPPLTLADVRRVLSEENTELPSGRIEGATTELTVKASGRLQSVEEFENLVLRVENGALVRLRDVGTVRLGAENERSILKRDGVPMIGLGLVAQPGANNLAFHHVADCLPHLFNSEPQQPPFFSRFEP
jgi:multidrug efflux pump subunit AcrB